MKLIHELVAGYAAQFPSKTAVADIHGEMSYGELETRSAALGAALTARGVAVGDVVAVYVPYAKEILLGAVSALRAGAIFSPFDDAYPEERLNYMLRDSAAAAVLTVRKLWEEKKLDFPEEKVVFMDEPREEGEETARCEGLSEDSPAMLLYTSGTTGNPKGVLHTHRMIVSHVNFMDIHEGAAMSADTRTGVMSSFSFVATETFLLGPLTRGGTACVAPVAARKDLDVLYRFLREARITHIFLPSGLAAVLAEDYDVSGIFIFAGGEKFRNFRPLSPGAFLINSYGSTEVACVLSKKIFGNEERMLVGKPFVSTKARLVDEEFKPVACGEAGELLIANDYPARYWKLPELSAEKWVELDGETWFRTGDRAVLMPSGDYDILGRVDNMVKLRGFRIETGEVEAQAANAVARLGRTDVRQIVAVVRTVGGTEHLCCYYEAEKELNRQAVTAEMANYLAEYMVPDIWVRMDAFPRNANGKVLRKELPQPKRARMTVGALDGEVVARVVWTAAEILGVDDFISPDDRFTDLGGTSLSAMRLALALREQGIKISGAQVLKLNALRKIAESADVVYEQLWSREEYEAVRRDFAERGEHIQKVLPISPQQDEMLFEQIIHPDRSDFRNVLLLQMDSLVSEEDLREALDVVAEENETLRSAIVFHRVTVIQQAVTDRKIPLCMLETDKFDRQAMSALRDRLLHSSMDLQRDSLMQAVCMHAEGMTFLYLLTHRIAFEKTRLRGYLARLTGLLEEKYPNDESIRGWRGIFELTREANSDDAPKTAAVSAKKAAPPELCVYSENKGPKLVFVHTGNTGSEAYYQLAARIGSEISFAVIEPFNLYHMDQARYGIQNIAANYIDILKRHQPKGPYLLGGWCYGGVVAHEMACQLERSGEEVRHLFMLDAHALADETLREMSKGVSSQIDRTYFETSPLFAELRESGMLEAMVSNAAHVTEDLANHAPSFFHGGVTYFKPDQIPGGATGDNRKYWEKMMEFDAGNYERYCDAEKLKIIHTPHEHDLMMDGPSLDVIAPEIMRVCLENGETTK